MTQEWLTFAEKQQLDETAKDALRLQREIPATTEQADPLRQKFIVATSKGNPATLKTIEKATVMVIYTRSVKSKSAVDGYRPWFNRLRKELEKNKSTYLQPLQPPNRLTHQRPDRYERLKTKNYARDPITLLPMGKDLLQKTRIALFKNSSRKSSYSTNINLLDVRVMNMLCTLLSEMAEVTDKMFAPASAETIPLPLVLVYSNVLDHLALRGC